MTTQAIARSRRTSRGAPVLPVLGGLKRIVPASRIRCRRPRQRRVHTVSGSTERRRSRTYPAVGYTTSPVLKVCRSRCIWLLERGFRSGWVRSGALRCAQVSTKSGTKFPGATGVGRTQRDLSQRSRSAYGKSRSFGGEFKCTSRKDGVLCRSLVTARCFLVAREGSKFTCTPKPGGGRPGPTPTPTRNCHPSYEGACLDPNASDYDCAGGSGNGPYYTGPVKVVGPDEFGLDADGDGYGCEG